MRVLLGVCGLGFGHSVRQSCILDVLLERGCSVVVFAFASSHAYFSKHFGGRVPVIEVKVPWVVCLADGIDWTQTHARNRSDYGAISATTNRAFASAIELLGGLPDLCISDYEPTTAQFAYLHDIPLVTIDQQSKFLGYRTQDVDGYCRNEERARLAYFFPSASQRFALSYFPLDAEADSQFDVTVLPASVRPGVHALSRLPSPPRTRSIVVYLSPYDKTGMYRDLVGVLRRFKDYEFHIYDLTATQSILPEPDCPSHLSFRCFNEQEFLRAVWRAQGVISTAGFTLLSELAYLRKPAFTVPLPTYDQHFHSDRCQRLGFGISAKGVDEGRLGQFLEQLSTYESNLRTCELTFSRQRVVDVITDVLAKHTKISRRPPSSSGPPAVSRFQSGNVHSGRSGQANLPKVALVCPGLGFIRRGHETFAQSVAELVAGSVDLHLFQGQGGDATRQLQHVRLDDPRLHDLASRADRIEIWQRSYFYNLLPHLLVGHYDVIHCTESPMAHLMVEWADRLPTRPRILYSNGGSMPPSAYPAVDYLHQYSFVAYAAGSDHFPIDRTFLIPHAVDTRRFCAAQRVTRSSAFRTSFSIPEDAYLILVVGDPNRPSKRVQWLLRALSETPPDWYVMILGQLGDDPQNLTALARHSLGPRCRFHELPNDEIFQAYAAADVLLHACLEEPFGIVFVEALTAGLPVVAADAPGHRWVLGDAACFVDGNSPEALVGALSALRTNPELRRRKVAAARELVRRRYSSEVLQQAFVAMYQTAAASRPVPRSRLADAGWTSCQASQVASDPC